MLVTVRTRSKSPAVSLGGRMHVSCVLVEWMIGHGFALMANKVNDLLVLKPEPLMVSVELPFMKPARLLDSLSIVNTFLINGHVVVSHALLAWP